MKCGLIKNNCVMITIEKLKELLDLNIRDVSIEELTDAVSIIGFKVKELKNGHTTRFELHYKRLYAFEVAFNNNDRLVSFNNEYVSFEDDLSGMSTPIITLREFYAAILYMTMAYNVPYKGVFYPPDCEITEEQLEKLVEVVNKEVLKKEYIDG